MQVAAAVGRLERDPAAGRPADLALAHTVEVLDASLRGLPVDSLSARVDH
jgi:hypothetical protein